MNLEINMPFDIDPEVAAFLDLANTVPLPSELGLDTLVTVTFKDGSTRTEIAGIFDWSTVASYVEVEQ